MSMPTIVVEDMTFLEAIANVAASIALEEAALSHIINAEGEKLQAIAKTATNVNELISVNESVANLLGEAMQVERLLLEKLNVAIEAYKKSSAAAV